ncbi:restriction endonuclease subunit S [Helcobacillus massiliensis]|uniref:restriction endonuclease subunit S n=1 Tax=Helcobacillus massiliensis TaxID=521392 RepID=UPI0025555450|nr:restriction endonuclease subunit S [Helcobacillus massiliensis]MDK7741340.1 restriction endonuclease subunit S [Helcobacillus massiliensis]WOO92809.1 restriction endonuclease subunit S [Helcobacillus massiliensis]
MSDVWPVARLSHLVEFLPGIDHSKVEDPDGCFPVFGSGGEFARSSVALRHGEGVLFGRKGTVDRPTYVSGKFWHVDTAYFARPRDRRLHPKYLAYWSQTIPFGLLSTNTALPSVTSADLGELTIPVPPHSTQTGIADYLDHETAEIDEFVKDLKTLQTLTVERRWAALNEQLSDLSLASTLTPLKVHAVIQAGLTLGTNYANKDLSDYPYLRVANVQDGSLDLDEIKTVAVPANVAQAVTLREGDVLVTEGGDRDKLGRGAIWPGHIAPMLHQNHVFAVRCKETLEPEYLTYVLEGQRARVYFDQTARQSTNLASTNVTLLRSFRFPVPSVEQQREFIKRQKTTDRICAAELEDITRAITLAKERRAALITAAVTGQIDVTKKNRPAVEQLQDDIEEQK